MKLLLVEDEKDLLESIGEGLRGLGYYVDLASRGEEAMDYILSEDHDLYIFDLNLPDLSGFDLLRALHREKQAQRVLLLTANTNLEAKIEGFNLGASDYLTKPFHFEELEVRIKALLRRQFQLQDLVLSFEDLRFDTGKRVLEVKGRELSLTKKETAIMEYLLRNQEKLVTAEDLLAHAWDSEVDYFSNSIRVHLATLRKKIKEVLGYNPIVNKVGEGYFLKGREE